MQDLTWIIRKQIWFRNNIMYFVDDHRIKQLTREIRTWHGYQVSVEFEFILGIGKKRLQIKYDFRKVFNGQSLLKIYVN